MKHYVSRCLIGIVGILSAITVYDQVQRVIPAVIPVQSTGLMPEDEVSVTARAYSGEESKLYLSHDLVSRGLQPVEIAVHNRSSLSLSLCASSVDLPSVGPSDAAFQVTKGAIPRGVAWRVASLVVGLFFWPASIPFGIDGIRTLSHHQSLKTDYRAKSFKSEGEIVAPYSIYYRILFVPREEFDPHFKVTLIDLETLDQKVYEVAAQSPSSST